MPSGYSTRSLIDKLGVKANSRVLILHTPAGYDETLGPLPTGVTSLAKLATDLDFIHAFFLWARELEREFPALKKALTQNGTLWISWPKKAAKIETDLTESVVRETGLR